MHFIQSLVHVYSYLMQFRRVHKLHKLNNHVVYAHGTLLMTDVKGQGGGGFEATGLPLIMTVTD
jgi:hypothetical protein